jgi:hypothetical protein
MVSNGLTQRKIGRLEDELRRRTRLLLRRIEDGARVDFLVDVAAEPPMQAICILLGVPEEDRHRLFEAVESSFDFREGRATFDTADAAAGAQARMLEYGMDLIAAKRRRPTDDMLSVVVHATLADVAPPTLSDAELYAFLVLLFSAGADTTRNAIAAGLLALIERPAELAALRVERGLLAGAIEEMLRWTTPSPAKRRTATRTAELGGHRISAATASNPATRCSSGRDRPTATSASFRGRASSTSAAIRIRTSPSVTAFTTASAPTSRGWRCGSSSRSSCRRSRRTSSPARSSGRAATVTPASATCRSDSAARADLARARWLNDPPAAG